MTLTDEHSEQRRKQAMTYVADIVQQDPLDFEDEGPHVYDWKILSISKPGGMVRYEDGFGPGLRSTTDEMTLFSNVALHYDFSHETFRLFTEMQWIDTDAVDAEITLSENWIMAHDAYQSLSLEQAFTCGDALHAQRVFLHDPEWAMLSRLTDPGTTEAVERLLHLRNDITNRLNETNAFERYMQSFVSTVRDLLASKAHCCAFQLAAPKLYERVCAQLETPPLQCVSVLDLIRNKPVQGSVVNG